MSFSHDNLSHFTRLLRDQPPGSELIIPQATGTSLSQQLRAGLFKGKTGGRGLLLALGIGAPEKGVGKNRGLVLSTLVTRSPPGLRDVPAPTA